MVTTKLYGRHSNQLFQIANCMAFALRNGLEYHIPAHTENDEIWPPSIKHLENPNYNPNLRTIQINEHQHNYWNIPFIEEYRNCNVRFNGYFQSQKFFYDYIKEVREALGFDYSVKKTAVIALHKRLGDYKQHKTKHYIISDEYVRDALEKMAEFGYNNCLVFSDEIQEAKSSINTELYPKWNFEYSESKTVLEDFQDMLNCESFIISASTFSLMAAILSESENKKVIAPKTWFLKDNSHLSDIDIVPSNYIKL